MYICIYIYIYIYELKFIHMHTYQNTYMHSNIQYTNTVISTRDNTLTKASKISQTKSKGRKNRHH